MGYEPDPWEDYEPEWPSLEEFMRVYGGEVYDSLYEDAVGEFTVERLRSYYLKYPREAEPALALFAEAEELLTAHPNAALVLAFAAIEVGLKRLLLKPIVYGLVHTESVASLVTEAVGVKKPGFDQFKNLLFQILSDYCGVRVTEHKRPGAVKSLWEEITTLKEARNNLMHSAAACTSELASQAVEVAKVVLREFFPTVVIRLDLHLHEGVRICNDRPCPNPESITHRPDR